MPSAKPTVGVDDLATLFPEIAAEAYGWNPSTVKAGSNKPLAWKCSKGHIFTKQSHERTKLKAGCYYCSGRKILKGFNDLATTHPELAAEAYGWDPTELSYGSEEEKCWKCPKFENHIYPAIIYNRSINGSGCSFCSNTKVLAGFNDLETKYPEIASEAVGWDPKTVLPGSNEEKEWWCDKGHSYPQKVKERIRGRKCCFCSGKRILLGFNDLKTTHPLIAAEAYNWDPETITAGSGEEKNWWCKKGHFYPARVVERTRRRPTGCSICDGKKVLVGFNDLQTTFPLIAAEAYGWNPTTVTAASSKDKMNWLCKSGHIYPAYVSSRTCELTGCPDCAKSGFSPEKQAWFYLMQRPGEQQIGITNKVKKRIRDHEKEGWLLLDKAGPAKGREVLNTEIQFKKWLKEKIGLIAGRTENWATTSMEVQTLAELKAKSGIQTDLF